MKKGWTTTKLLAIGGIATLGFVIDLSATLITVFTGLPLGSGFITAIVGTTIVLLSLLIIDRFGTATIYHLIYTALAIPTHLWGPPGFFPKIAIGLGIGILTDLAYFFLKKTSRFSALVFGAIAINLGGTIMFVSLGRLLEVPGVEKTAWFLSSPFIILALVPLGMLDAFLALKVFGKIKNTAVVKRIQSG